MMMAYSVVWCGLLFLAIHKLSQAGLTVEAGGANRRTVGRDDTRTPPENQCTGSINGRLAALERLFSRLATRVQELETRNRELELAVAKRSTEPVDLALQQLSSQNAKLAKEVEELKRRKVWVNQGKADREGAGQEGNIVRNELNDENRDVNYLEESERDQESDTKKSAFAVASSHHQLGLERQMQYVTFDYNIANKGGDFYFNNNSFTCRIPGFYFFTFTLRTFENRNLVVVMMKNDSPIVSVSTDLSASRSISSTQSMIVMLSHGDSVWLRIPPSEDVGIYSDDWHYTTFSGFLV